MLKARDVATKSVPKKAKLAVYLPPILVIMGLLVLVLAINPKSKCELKISNDTVNECISLEFADNNETRSMGLSGREKLKDNQGMMFVFDEEATRCFWMKDMKFDLDMIWLNSEKRIVAIESNVHPDSYPQQYCHDNSRYVLEINNGNAKILGLGIGKKLSF